MKIAFTTCVQLGKSCIEEIYKIGGSLDLMITLKDEKAKNKSGRIYLDDLAKEHNVPLLKINHINDKEVLDAIEKYNIDWLFIIGWSQIAGEGVLNAPTYGCIGMHPTLLPKGRGRAAIPWAILKGLDRTGVTMFKLDAGVDTGDIIGQGIIPLDEQTTATELYEKVDEMHISLIRDYWEAVVNNTVELKKQDDSIATEWPGRKPADGEIFATMSMQEAERLVRAVTHPYPGAFYIDGNQKVIIWKATVQTEPDKNGIKLADGYLIPLEYEIAGLEEK
ncbi:MAG: methionyl-tRNA formyltransferase [Lachnospiraceae bacterium]|nr:methionyl-tRNA formyltransferase [Lachnospiraceae bacterium]